tara:strand:- start:961 stop:1224 length:264 start_codon:yes stop_codon:yes gene_type:complete
MKWLTLVFVIVTLGAITILLYKVVSQIFSYKTKNPTTRRWCALHNRYFIKGTVCPRCKHFENIEITHPGRRPIFPGEDTRGWRISND